MTLCGKVVEKGPNAEDAIVVVVIIVVVVDDDKDDNDMKDAEDDAPRSPSHPGMHPPAGESFFRSCSSASLA